MTRNQILDQHIGSAYTRRLYALMTDTVLHCKVGSSHSLDAGKRKVVIHLPRGIKSLHLFKVRTRVHRGFFDYSFFENLAILINNL